VRKFPDFITAYLDYVDNGFAPRKFHVWSALSLLAGALERKVWLPWNHHVVHYPNLYVMLVAFPGVGKSASAGAAVSLLSDLNRQTRDINFIPERITEAAVYSAMSEGSSFTMGSKVYMHSSGFWYGPEASAHLRDVYGDFIATLTDFYDCRTEVKTRTEGKGLRILKNTCFNLLTACTFDYLSRLITDENIMGGFASRITYVINRDKLVRDSEFQDGGGDPEKELRLQEFRASLLHDLGEIHRMAGPFKAHKTFGDLWKAWHKKFEAERQEHPSEKMQSLLARKNATVLKVAMILSASESDAKILTPDHWEQAMALVNDVEKDLPGMLRESRAGQIHSQDSLTQAIFRYFEKKPDNVVLAELKKALFLRGFDPRRVETAIDTMVKQGVIQTVSERGRSVVKLIVDMNAHL